MGFKFTDKLLLNAEIEFEHANEVFVEFAAIDYLHSPEFNLRFGMVLMPIGFLNEIHEPAVLLRQRAPRGGTANHPEHVARERRRRIRRKLPAVALQYRLYTTTNLRADKFSESGMRGGRQKGSKALADMAIVARVDATPMDGVLVGGSVLMGNTGQGLQFGGSTPDVAITMWEVHGQYQYRGLHLRALYVRSDHRRHGNHRPPLLGRASVIPCGVGTAKLLMIFCPP